MNKKGEELLSSIETLLWHSTMDGYGFDDEEMDEMYDILAGIKNLKDHGSMKMMFLIEDDDND